MIGAGSKRDQAISFILDHLREAPKYRSLCEDSLFRFAAWAAERHPDPREAVKAAKRKLHQAYGAYIGRVRFDRIAAGIADLHPGMPEEQVKAVCGEILASHASTAERIPIMEAFYESLFQVIGSPVVISDLACGMNPFSLPWMRLPPETVYRPVDVDRRLIASANDLLKFLGRTPAGICGDLLVSPPVEETDVVFLFKTLPCLEQQEKGAATRVLKGLRTRVAVVSFPTRTLGGRDVGMVNHYGQLMARIAADLRLSVHQMTFPGEIFHICRYPR